MVITCVKCTKNISPRSATLKCRECSGWHHTWCISLPTEQVDEYLDEAKKENGKRFVCSRCLHVSAASSPSSGQYRDAMPNVSLYSLQQTMERMMVMMQDKFSVMESMIMEIQGKTESLNFRIDAVERRTEQVEIAKSIGSGLGTGVADIVAEINERKNRESNLVLYDIPETVGNDSGCIDDATIVKEGLNKFKPGVIVKSLSARPYRSKATTCKSGII